MNRNCINAAVPASMSSKNRVSKYAEKPGACGGNQQEGEDNEEDKKCRRDSKLSEGEVFPREPGYSYHSVIIPESETNV